MPRSTAAQLLRSAAVPAGGAVAVLSPDDMKPRAREMTGHGRLHLFTGFMSMPLNNRSCLDQAPRRRFRATTGGLDAGGAVGLVQQHADLRALEQRHRVIGMRGADAVERRSRLRRSAATARYSTPSSRSCLNAAALPRPRLLERVDRHRRVCRRHRQLPQCNQLGRPTASAGVDLLPQRDRIAQPPLLAPGRRRAPRARAAARAPRATICSSSGTARAHSCRARSAARDRVRTSGDRGASAAARLNASSACASWPSDECAVASRSAASRLFGSSARIFSSSGIACAYRSATNRPRRALEPSKRRTMSAGRGASFRTIGAAPALT